MRVHEKAVRPYMLAVKEPRSPQDLHFTPSTEVRVTMRGESSCRRTPCVTRARAADREARTEALGQMVQPAALAWLPDVREQFKIGRHEEDRTAKPKAWLTPGVRRRGRKAGDLRLPRPRLRRRDGAREFPAARRTPPLCRGNGGSRSPQGREVRQAGFGGHAVRACCRTPKSGGRASSRALTSLECRENQGSRGRSPSRATGHATWATRP